MTLLLCLLIDKSIGFLMFQCQTPRRENLIFGFQISSNKPIGVEGGTGSHGQRDIVEAVLSNRYEISR